MFKKINLLTFFIFTLSFSWVYAEHLEGVCIRSASDWVKTSDVISNSASYTTSEHHEVEDNNVCKNVDQYYSVTFDLNPNELIYYFASTGDSVSWDTTGNEWIATITSINPSITSRGPFFSGIKQFLTHDNKYQIDVDMKASRTLTLNTIGYEQNDYYQDAYTINDYWNHYKIQVKQNDYLTYQAFVIYNSGTYSDTDHEWQVGDKLYVKNFALSKEVKAGEKVGDLWKPATDSFKGWYDQYGNLVTEDTVVTENLQISYRTIKTETDSYKILDYLGSSGTQWTMTDLDTKEDTWFDLSFSQRAQSVNNGYNFLIGSWGSLSAGTNGSYFVTNSGGWERNVYDSSIITEIRPSIGTKYNIINGQGYATINGISVMSNIQPNSSSDLKLLLFANNGPCLPGSTSFLKNNCAFYGTYWLDTPYKWGSYYSNDNLYYVRIYEGPVNNTSSSKLVGNFVPARRQSDGELGFFDSVSKNFYTNLGTGEFIASPSLTTSEYKNNTLYINGEPVPQLSGKVLASDGVTITDPADGYTWQVSFDLNVWDNGTLNYSYQGPVTFEFCVDDVCSGEYTDAGCGVDLWSNHKIEYRPKYVPAGYTVEYPTYYLYDDLLPNMGFDGKNTGPNRFVIGINPTVTH